ncbi:hypothetical protein Rrhod_2270 [Rhodococcus rhodnii LMG 5362]|uniref:Uncharacterized protein n=1 Tax=Rhodococcus rhodnii LMG 5362 TaxID=1273125 RepID=R7WMH2_9NOCA|nr:hypothetical protein Rrhod_2270 [Rhodococcus rhodnii LMG 5362]
MSHTAYDAPSETVVRLPSSRADIPTRPKARP